MELVVAVCVIALVFLYYSTKDDNSSGDIDPTNISDSSSGEQNV